MLYNIVLSLKCFINSEFYYKVIFCKCVHMALIPCYVNSFGSLIEDESLYLSRSGGWRVVNLTTNDGVSLHNYWLHANNIQHSASSPVPTTILYLHPNADRIVI